MSQPPPSQNNGRRRCSPLLCSSTAHDDATASQIHSVDDSGMELLQTAMTRELSVRSYEQISTCFEQVTTALRREVLESPNLIIGIDFTTSNECTGKVSFNNQSLHAIGDTLNPYEMVISIIGKTLAPFHEDNLIPCFCFGFGDETTLDRDVFSFHSDHSPCQGFEEVLDCYRKLVPNVQLAGPTSYAPIVEAAIDIVEKSGGQYHVLVIIVDGEVTRGDDTSDKELSPQEEQTIKAILNASAYPLSIVLVGVGDGPWEDMKKFNDNIPLHGFDNFQFVNFTEIISKDATPSAKETAFAHAALMEIPSQYKAAVELGILGHHPQQRAKKIFPHPPLPYTSPTMPTHEPSNLSSSEALNHMDCSICLTNAKEFVFGCGHMTCQDCSTRISNCPICCQLISYRQRVYF